MYQSPIYILSHNALQPPIAHPQQQIYNSPSYFSNSHYSQQSGFGNSYFLDNYSQNSGYQASHQPAPILYFPSSTPTYPSSTPIYQEQIFQVSNPYFQSTSPNYQGQNPYLQSVAPIYQQSSFQNPRPYFQSASPNYQGQIFQDSGSYFPSLGQDYSSMQNYHSSTYLINNFPSQNGFTNHAQTQQNYRVNDPFQITLTEDSRRNLDKPPYQISLTEESRRNLQEYEFRRAKTPAMSKDQLSWQEAPTFIPESPKSAFQFAPSSDASQQKIPSPYDEDKSFTWQSFLGINLTSLAHINGSSSNRERNEFIQKTWNNYLERQVEHDRKDLVDSINEYRLSGKGKFLKQGVIVDLSQQEGYPNILDRVTSFELLMSQQKIPSETRSRDINQFGFIKYGSKQARHN